MTNNTINICFASNNKYVDFLSVSMISILYNTKKFINFYILDSGISNIKKDLLLSSLDIFNNFSIEFIKIDLDLFKDFCTCLHFSLDIYSRYLIAQLKPDIDRIIYLDCDIIVLDDINKLFSENIDDFIIGAVQEYRDNNLLNKIKRNLKIQSNYDFKYFNSGVLLIDIKKWNKNNITETLFNLIKSFNNNLYSPDQDILNKLFYNNYKILDKKYNLIKRDFLLFNTFNKNKKDTIMKANEEIVIRHFTGVKPWENNVYITESKIKVSIPYFYEFWFFAKISKFYTQIFMNYCKNLNKNIFY